MTDQDTIPVVNFGDAAEEAYSMGYERFDGIDLGGEELEGFDLDGFRSSAAYANHVLPSLRALAGFGDRGHGTYQVDREVALLDPADADDNPAEARVVESHYLLDDLLRLWESGAYDAAEGAGHGFRLDY